VNLAIPFQKDMKNQHAVLSQLSPLIGSINSLKTLYNNPFDNIYNNGHKNGSNDDDDYAKMIATMLEKARILETLYVGASLSNSSLISLTCPLISRYKPGSNQEFARG
jgi:hypothetical protein